MTEGFETDPKKGFVSHADFFKAVMTAETTRQVDPRLAAFQAAQGSDEQTTSQNPYGGFLVPVTVFPGLLQVTPEMDPLASRVRPIMMASPRVMFNARVDKDHSDSVSGGLLVTRRAELIDGPESRQQYEQITLNAHELFGVTFASDRILRDSMISIVSLLQTGFGQEFASHSFFERIWGSGTGEPLGVMTVPQGTGPRIRVAKETSQTADTIVKQNIDKMTARCWNRGGANLAGEL